MYNDFTLPYPLAYDVPMVFSMIILWVSIFQHIKPYKNHIKPYKNHVTPYKNHIKPYKNHVTPYKNHIKPYKNHVTPYKNHIKPYFNQRLQPTAVAIAQFSVSWAIEPVPLDPWVSGCEQGPALASGAVKPLKNPMILTGFICLEG